MIDCPLRYTVARVADPLRLDRVGFNRPGDESRLLSTQIALCRLDI